MTTIQRRYPALGKVEPLAEIGTDPGRWASYTRISQLRRTPLRRLPVALPQFHKTGGYANQPLDGIWARSPYLHNGVGADAARTSWSRALGGRRVWYRGSDEFDLVKRWLSVRRRSRRADRFSVTTPRGPGNARTGHDGPRYGTELPMRPKGRHRRIYENAMTGQLRSVSQWKTRHAIVVGIGIVLNFVYRRAVAALRRDWTMGFFDIPHERHSRSGRALRRLLSWIISIFYMPGSARPRPLPDLRLARGAPVAHLRGSVPFPRRLLCFEQPSGFLVAVFCIDGGVAIASALLPDPDCLAWSRTIADGGAPMRKRFWLALLSEC